MNSKEKFDAEKWDSIDEVNLSSVPKYEFEDKDDSQSKSFSANDWFVENEESVDEKIDVLKEKTKKAIISQGDSIKSGEINDVNESLSNNAYSYSKIKRISVIVLIVIAIIAILSVLFAINQDSNYDYSYDNTGYQDNETTITTTTTTTATTEYIESDYWEGKCGDYANYTIYNVSEDAENPYYILDIEGKGALWNPEDIDWQIDGGKINEIWVYDGITEIQENQFFNGTFDNVIEIHFFDTVNYIGKSACAGIETLEKVYVDSIECDIVYIDDEGYLYNTLGNTESGVTIVCYEDSTAEEYVNTWNDNYSNSYKLTLY